MKLICKKHRAGLTVDAMYTEKFPYPCPFNACVTNDEGEPMIVPRDEFFDVVGGEIKGKGTVFWNASTNDSELNWIPLGEIQGDISITPKRCEYNDCGWCYAENGIHHNSENGQCNKPNECGFYNDKREVK